jgi:DUF917 family protein
MIDVSEMEEGAYGAMAACLGSPKAITSPDVSFIDVVKAFGGLQSELAREGKDLKYVYSGEYGGLNTCVAMYISIVNGTPVLDLDSNVRAVPELNTGLTPIYGFPPYPVVLSNEVGDVTVVRTADPEDSSGAELIARQLCQAYNMKIGFSTWAVSRSDIEKYLVPGTLTRAQVVGHAILEAKAAKTDPVEAIGKAIKVKELCRGKLETVDVVTKEGFDFGTTIVDAVDGKYRVQSKNENMVVLDPSGNVIVTVPESICMINLDDYEPLSNADTKVGMNVAFVGVPAAEPWWKIPEGFTCWKHILDKMGLETGPVRLG